MQYRGRCEPPLKPHQSYFFFFEEKVVSRRNKLVQIIIHILFLVEPFKAQNKEKEKRRKLYITLGISARCCQLVLQSVARYPGIHGAPSNYWAFASSWIECVGKIGWADYPEYHYSHMTRHLSYCYGQSTNGVHYTSASCWIRGHGPGNFKPNKGRVEDPRVE